MCPDGVTLLHVCKYLDFVLRPAPPAAPRRMERGVSHLRLFPAGKVQAGKFTRLTRCISVALTRYIFEQTSRMIRPFSISKWRRGGNVFFFHLMRDGDAKEIRDPQLRRACLCARAPAVSPPKAGQNGASVVCLARMYQGVPSRPSPPKARMGYSGDVPIGRSGAVPIGMCPASLLATEYIPPQLRQRTSSLFLLAIRIKKNPTVTRRRQGRAETGWTSCTTTSTPTRPSRRGGPGRGGGTATSCGTPRTSTSSPSSESRETGCSASTRFSSSSRHW